MDSNNSASHNQDLYHQTNKEISRHFSSKPGFHFESKLWAVGGGKGGVGKSLIAANTAINLAKLGHRVVAIDLDLGGANLHTCLGVPIPEKTLTDYLAKKVVHIKDVLIDTPFENLQLISGAQDELGVANLKTLSKKNLLKGLKQLDVDYIVLDLGAGTTFNTLDFFLASDLGILVTLPEPTSIENTYRFIKSLFFRKLHSFEGIFEVDSLIDRSQSAKLTDEMNSPKDLLMKIKEIEPQIGEYIIKEFQEFKLNLVLNQVRTGKEKELGNAISQICGKYFGLNVDYLASIEHDASVWQSVKSREPLMKIYPNAMSAEQIGKMVNKLVFS